MYCVKCGHKNTDRAKFCVSCGAQLPGGGTASPWQHAGDLSGESGYARPAAPVRTTEPVRAAHPPVSSVVRGTPQPAAAAQAEKPAGRKWLVPLIILAVLAVIAVVLFVTAKECGNCGKIFWGGSHNLFGYDICNDCWGF